MQAEPGPPTAPGRASPLSVHMFVYSYRPSSGHRLEPGSPPHTGLLLQGTGTRECFLKVSCCPKVPIPSGCFYLDFRITQRAFSQELGRGGHLYLWLQRAKNKASDPTTATKALESPLVIVVYVWKVLYATEQGHLYSSVLWKMHFPKLYDTAF